ncbi:MAG: Asr1405/Asl0597 family protein, partial [Bellilinea sp.]
SECRADGSLDVQVKNSCEAILLCMILARVTTTHAEHLQWLERCWNLSVPSGG